MAIQTGDKCPTFSLPDQNGQIVNSDELIGKKILVIYFYPKNETSGCTREACSFRDSYEEFKDLGCEVIGISSDSVSSHKKFEQNHRLNFILLADTKKEVRKAFGVPPSLFGLISGRVTYIVDLQGTVRGVYNSLTDAEGHIREALRTVKDILS
jgi:peroxiredoxin Q/BCP